MNLRSNSTPDVAQVDCQDSVNFASSSSPASRRSLRMLQRLALLAVVVTMAGGVLRLRLSSQQSGPHPGRLRAQSMGRLMAGVSSSGVATGAALTGASATGAASKGGSLISLGRIPRSLLRQAQVRA